MENSILNLIVVFVILLEELEWGIYMSEKRFSVKSIKNNHYQIADNDLKMLSYEVVDFLNTSSDAIDSLQYENVKLKKKVDEQQSVIKEQYERIRELESILADDIVRKSEIKEVWKQRTEKRWNDV